jgi:hypothetical protein
VPKLTLQLNLLPEDRDVRSFRNNARHVPKKLHFVVDPKTDVFVFTAVFLGAFAKLREMTTGFLMEVRPSVLLFVCMEQFDSHWTDFDKIKYLSFFFQKFVEKLCFVKI